MPDDVTTTTNEYDLTRLRPSERVWLWRWRQTSPTGRTGGWGGARIGLREAANLLEVRLADYRMAEEDDAAARELLPALAGAPGARLRQTVEMLAVARKRAGVGVDELCRELRCTPPTYYAQERNASYELIALWQRRGYTFS